VISSNLSPQLQRREQLRSHVTLLTRANKRMEIERVADPQARPLGGRFRGEISVELTCSTPGARIHYSLDDSPPSRNSPKYHPKFPLLIRRNTTVKCVALLPDQNLESRVTTFTYFFEE